MVIEVPINKWVWLLFSKAWIVYINISKLEFNLWTFFVKLIVWWYNKETVMIKDYMRIAWKKLLCLLVHFMVFLVVFACFHARRSVLSITMTLYCHKHWAWLAFNCQTFDIKLDEKGASQFTFYGLNTILEWLKVRVKFTAKESKAVKAKKRIHYNAVDLWKGSKTFKSLRFGFHFT